jgi:hypothetical protein
LLLLADDRTVSLEHASNETTKAGRVARPSLFGVKELQELFQTLLYPTM